ncbi:MAG: ABC transporter substrate-binding protein [Anaerolineaceae bacterium]|nr:ABC transporter substrate-binding protein [Anaerolineaceae bacterium]
MSANKACTLLLVATSIISFSSACSSLATKPPALTPITVQLQWTHQAEFAGLYAADQEGYYAAEGLAVTFIQGGPEIDHLAAVRDKKAQFGTASADQLIVARSQGMPLRAIATIFRRSPTVFFSLQKSGITRPQDFIGKKIRVASTLLATLHAMTTRVGVTPDQYSEVTLPSDIQMFASGEVPVWGGFINGMVIAIQQERIPINLINPDNYGVHFYGDTLITTDETINSNPELTLRFVRASLKGWTFAVENPEKISGMVAKLDPKADADLEYLRMTSSLPLINTGEDYIGWMKPEIWIGMEKTLRDQHVLQSAMDVTQVYTTKFLETIYAK